MKTRLLSHASDTLIGQILTCEAQLGYSRFQEKSLDWQTPFYFISGRIVHEGCEEIVKKYESIGPYDAQQDGLLNSLNVKASLRLNQKIGPEQRENIMWIPISLQQTLSASDQAKAIANIKRSTLLSINSAFSAVAKLCTLPKHHQQIWLEYDFSNLNISIPNLYDESHPIPIHGLIDRLDKTPTGYIVSDWKTGKKSRFSVGALKNNRQMLMYAYAIKQLFGEYPIASYIVSLDVTKSLVDSSPANLLESPDFRFLAEINPEEQLPELFRLYNDVWFMLKHLHQQNIGQEPIKTDWVPLSKLAQAQNLQENLSSNKLLARPGRECDMCPAKLICQQDNVDVWSEWNKKHLPGSYEEFLSNPYQDVPEPDNGGIEIPNTTLVENQNSQLDLFDLTGKKPSPLKNGKLKDKELRASGMYSAKQILAMLNKLSRFIPPVNGQLCPCRKTERIPLRFLTSLPNLLLELQDSKDNNKPLYTSQVVMELVKSCPVPGCPHNCKKEELCPPVLVENQTDLFI